MAHPTATAAFAATIPTPAHVLSCIDRIDDARDTLRALRALEQLLTPWHASERETLDMVDREGLALLLATLNGKLGTSLDRARADARDARSTFTQPGQEQTA